jgi:hypothetical protein
VVDPDGGGSCSRSAQLAAGSCRDGAIAAFRLASARCANLATPGEVEACVQSARAELDEALELCGEQLEARLSLCDALGDAPYNPVIDPESFVAEIDNPYLPLAPGTTFVYRKDTADGPELIEVSVGHEKRAVQGVDCTVIFETESEYDEDEEETVDWFAQDVEGNVWHFGGRTYEKEDGTIVAVTDSWEAGVDGAHAGVVMLATPTSGLVYRQQFQLAEAEDAARVMSLEETAEVPHGVFSSCVLTEDFTPIEPGFREHKLYAPGVGLVLEVDLESGERVELVDIRREDPTPRE